MSTWVGRRAKLLGLSATILLVSSLASAGPAAPVPAERNQCAAAGVDRASVLPKNLTENREVGHDDDHTTATVEPLSEVNVDGLGLGTAGVLTVGTLSDAPPNICITPNGEFSG